MATLRADDIAAFYGKKDVPGMGSMTIFELNSDDFWFRFSIPSELVKH